MTKGITTNEDFLEFSENCKRRVEEYNGHSRRIVGQYCGPMCRRTPDEDPPSSLCTEFYCPRKWRSARIYGKRGGRCKK